jgi:hypothetical protein
MSGIDNQFGDKALWGNIMKLALEKWHTILLRQNRAQGRAVVT